MSSTVVGELQPQEVVEARVESGDAPTWVADHWQTFSNGLLGERNNTPFPCFFGAESVRDGDPLYTAVPSMTDKDALLGLGRTLLEYLETYQEHSERASLVTFFRPPSRDLSEAEYHETLWHILQFLHIHDPEPWPEDIPTEPDDPHWEFSFGGEPIFPTCRAPFYEERKSRYCPIGLEITFQPRALFENLNVTADEETGQRAREIIQGRLEEYDGVCPHADLGDWGVDGDREWVQYMLSSDETQMPDVCPITVTREHPKSDILLDRSEPIADTPRR
ncbi:YqcI/YcgG family protein [Natronomonas salina]|uniref:YqcI/YcgG family protein n=1 Tax=Natronomonas salina TaxID=1710540 RepID=UPI0015B72632|nr:YqcI/YcgG family protein [Natronomonas salina]QLD89176.1 YqcI/YcgG family protein [Natronomonas salina]